MLFVWPLICSFFPAASSFPVPPTPAQPPPTDPRRRRGHHQGHHHRPLPPYPADHIDDFEDDRHHAASHHHHHHHQHQHSLPSRDSMDNLVGTSSLFRGNNNAFQARWRSRSSPAVAHRFRGGWMDEENNSFGYPFPRQRSQSPQAHPRHFMHSSFHDLHAANELRASRQDLRELRDLLRQTQTNDLDREMSRRSSRRGLHERKWPHGMPGSPSCRRCAEGQARRF